MQNFSLIQLAAEGILMLHYNPSVIFFAKMPPPFTQGRRFLVLVLLFGVIFLDCRGGYYPPDFYKINPYLFQQVILSERSESNFWEGER